MGINWYVPFSTCCYLSYKYKFANGLGSISFSVLAGRISFKDLRYHSANQTILVVKGQISWRYWIRVPAEEDDLIHARVIGEGIQRAYICPYI